MVSVGFCFIKSLICRIKFRYCSVYLSCLTEPNGSLSGGLSGVELAILNMSMQSKVIIFRNMQIVCYENNIQHFEPQTLRLGNTLHYGTSPQEFREGCGKTSPQAKRHVSSLL